jgi:trehalose-6-phosphatase
MVLATTATGSATTGTGAGSALGGAATAALSSTLVVSTTFSSNFFISFSKIGEEGEDFVVSVGDDEDDDDNFNSAASIVPGTSSSVVVVVVGAVSFISDENNIDDPLFTLEGAVNADVDVAAIATLMTTAENFIVCIYFYIIRVVLMN